MNKKKCFKQTGFTLVEVVVVIAIFTVLIFLVSSMLNDIFVNSSGELASMGNIDQARSALSAFTNEIRDATYGSDGSYPLNQASDSQIIFYTNLGTSNATVKRVRYYISGNILYKGVVWPTGSPLSYHLSSEVVSPVASGISNGSSPAFYYYDGSYNGNTDNYLNGSFSINNVRFVRVNLKVLNKITAGDNSAFYISGGATIRALKDNLGG